MIQAKPPVTGDNKPDDAEGGLPFPSAVAWSSIGGLVLGGVTQLGQSFLPDWLRSIANSGSPWVLIAVGFALSSGTAWGACVSGTLALAGLEFGYVIVAALRGFPSSWTTVTFWLTAAAVFGPLAGLAAYYFRVRRSPWDGLGMGLIAGIVSGEALVSFLTVRDTTTPVYWIGQMMVGVVIVVLVGRRTGFTWAVLAFAVGVAGLWATRSISMFGS